MRLWTKNTPYKLKKKKTEFWAKNNDNWVNIGFTESAGSPLHEAMISPQIATTSLTCQRLPRLNSGWKVQKKLATSIKNHPWWSKSRSAHATLETWTWAPSATWAPPPWQCGNQASWRPTATWPPLTSTRPQGHSDWTTQTPWARASSYPRSPRYEVKHISNKNRLLSIFRAKYTTMPTKRTWRLWTYFLGSQQYMVSSLQPYSEIIREWVKMGVFRTYRFNILFQNTKGCQRWLGWTSSLALAASVDFA